MFHFSIQKEGSDKIGAFIDNNQLVEEEQIVESFDNINGGVIVRARDTDYNFDSYAYEHQRAINVANSEYENERFAEVHNLAENNIGVAMYSIDGKGKQYQKNITASRFEVLDVLIINGIRYVKFLVKDICQRSIETQYVKSESFNEIKWLQNFCNEVCMVADYDFYKKDSLLKLANILYEKVNYFNKATTIEKCGWIRSDEKYFFYNNRENKYLSREIPYFAKMYIPQNEEEGASTRINYLYELISKQAPELKSRLAYLTIISLMIPFNSLMKTCFPIVFLTGDEKFAVDIYEKIFRFYENHEGILMLDISNADEVAKRINGVSDDAIAFYDCNKKSISRRLNSVLVTKTIKNSVISAPIICISEHVSEYSIKQSIVINCDDCFAAPKIHETFVGIKKFLFDLLSRNPSLIETLVVQINSAGDNFTEGIEIFLNWLKHVPVLADYSFEPLCELLQNEIALNLFYVGIDGIVDLFRLRLREMICLRKVEVRSLNQILTNEDTSSYIISHEKCFYFAGNMLKDLCYSWGINAESFAEIRKQLMKDKWLETYNSDDFKKDLWIPNLERKYSCYVIRKAFFENNP